MMSISPSEHKTVENGCCGRLGLIPCGHPIDLRGDYDRDAIDGEIGRNDIVRFGKTDLQPEIHLPHEREELIMWHPAMDDEVVRTPDKQGGEITIDRISGIFVFLPVDMEDQLFADLISKDHCGERLLKVVLEEPEGAEASNVNDVRIGNL